jgi:glycerol-3-phosphate O-acyltransferase
MEGIAGVVPVLPVALVSTVLMAAREEEIEILSIEERAAQLQSKLQDRGAPVIDMSHTKQTGVIADAVDFLLLRRVITATDNKIRIVPEEAPILRYYTNAIAHWL